MNDLNINKILNREKQGEDILALLAHFYANKKSQTVKKGIYIYGETGVGKSQFIINLLKNNNYDVIKYDAGDIRNKTIIDNIAKNTMSDKNVMSLFQKKVKNIVIVMDEIDGMNNGDKGGINQLIKLIRPKKTKKQKTEEVSINPIICIGNYRIDKKIKELIKVCHSVELKSPTVMQMNSLLNAMLPNIEPALHDTIIQFAQQDLRKLNSIYKLFIQNADLVTNENLSSIFRQKSYIDDTKEITHKLFNQAYPLDNHTLLINDTDRTIIGLLWHENVIDILEPLNKETSIPHYIELLDNMCFADYIDRNTFQRQIWQFNEMSSLIKTFKNNTTLHEFRQSFGSSAATTTSSSSPKSKKAHLAVLPERANDLRFTKVLTKYSTEYNNTVFIQNLCQQLGMCKSDLFSFFFDLKNKKINTDTLFETYNITKLDVIRLYRYLEKYTFVDAIGVHTNEIEIDEIPENASDDEED
jgi:hypothetical protein